ncbi:LORF10 [Gallid alphaherpesvirus 2]|uniref:Uncharacterized gene 71 protein n=2 Tax=Gallid alphaherpesvirus 2 TaxID=10390 RepID=VG71_GAHVM|nr:myristylated tegument protein CIRC [Gallid alphaherpesvirus 2]Q9E6M2.1 RecName: Full=Uncharacterized gene 71 protein [Marek's disease herpesvirus type 1 strain MD5]QOJ42194.1 myristylated tegument protein CIRC [synthetic construct]AAG14251.1 hypothetical protein [Gallid alphaherpesvirus 2]AAS01701.1 hypothetical protein [Gallid alphaherpesvirus 2]ABR13147.1 LORF10 [Gallid alphaherpesvirus 2]AFM74637.1 LORF10 [Gallid alphaherpesvirus 2]
MGIIFSNPIERTDKTLIESLRGRNMDLPGGGDLWIFANAGTSTMKFTTAGSRTSIQMYRVGRARTDGLTREFVILKGQDGNIYGVENASCIHFMSQNLHEFICKTGISQRDLMVTMGTFGGYKLNSPPKRYHKYHDSSLGRRRGISVDRSANTASCTQYEHEWSASGVLSTINPNDRILSHGSSKVRFGPTTVD